MNRKKHYQLNDISHCIEQAHLAANMLRNNRRPMKRLSDAFKHLAGDETIGILAFAIWRGRSGLLSHTQAALDNEKAEVDTSGASHT